VTAAQGVGPQQQGRAHDVLAQRRADARGVGAEQVVLQDLGVLAADEDVPLAAEARRQAVHGHVVLHEQVHHRPAACGQPQALGGEPDAPALARDLDDVPKFEVLTINPQDFHG